MGIEIERKFAVIGDDWRAQVGQRRHLKQAYLASGPWSLRVRIDGDEANLNLKAMQAGAQRAEFEYPIPLADAEQLMGRSEGAAIDKIRHEIMHAGMLWEVDEFLGDNAGLIVAEIELEHLDQHFERPSWLGDELTDDRRYYNHQLAQHPYRLWEASNPC